MMEICALREGDAIYKDGKRVSKIYDEIIATREMLLMGNFIAIRQRNGKREYSYRKIEEGLEFSVTDWEESPQGLAKMYAYFFDEDKDVAQTVIEELLES